MPAVFFTSGVGYDTFTLTRIDCLIDNLILLLYLVAIGFLIVLTGRFGTAAAEPTEIEPRGSVFAKVLKKARPYYPMAMQFILGGLFSAYAVFYSQALRSPARRSFSRCWSCCWSAMNFYVIGSPAYASS